MPDQHGLGDNGTESTRPRQSGQGDDQMNEYDSEVAHSGNGINTSKTAALRPIWQFAIDKLRFEHLGSGVARAKEKEGGRDVDVKSRFHPITP
jgi:hypothetical protein